MSMDVLRHRLREVDHEVVLVRGDAIKEATEVTELESSERIGHERKRDQLAAKYREVLPQRAPVAAREQRVGPHRVALDRAGHLACEYRTSACWQPARRAELREGFRVRGAGVPDVPCHRSARPTVPLACRRDTEPHPPGEARGRTAGIRGPAIECGAASPHRARGNHIASQPCTGTGSRGAPAGRGRGIRASSVTSVRAGCNESMRTSTPRARRVITAMAGPAPQWVTANTGRRGFEGRNNVNLRMRGAPEVGIEISLTAKRRPRRRSVHIGSLSTEKSPSAASVVDRSM